MQEPKDFLHKKNCIITGAAGGLSSQIALTFWEAGANLLLVDRPESTISKLVADLCPRENQKAFNLIADLFDPSAPELIISLVYDFAY